MLAACVCLCMEFARRCHVKTHAYVHVCMVLCAVLCLVVRMYCNIERFNEIGSVQERQ